MPLLGRLTALTIILAAAIIAVALIHRAGGPQPAQAATTTPAAPTGLTATAGDTKVTLKWNASIGATGYNVWRRVTATGATWRQIAKTTTPSYTDTAVTNGTGYTYAVRAYNTAGQVSASSTFAYATPTASPAPAVPTVPTGLTATPGDGTVTLDWADNTDNYTRYQVYQDDKLIADGPTASTYTVTGLTNGTTYAFRVSAGSTGRYSPWTAPVTATPTAPTPDPTPTPTPAALFTGDFETGNLAQWGSQQFPAGAPMTITTSPVDQGTYAAKFTLAPGQLWNGTSRSELVGAGPAANLSNGQVRYFAWSVYLPADFSAQAGGSNWRVVAQWKNAGTGSPPLELKITDDHWQLDGGWNNGDNTDTSDLRTAWNAPIERGKWTRFVLGALFQERDATSPYRGWIELWKDGTQVLQRTPWKTLYLGRTSYLKAGLYRSTTITATDTIYHDAWRMGDTYDSITN